jgi:nanoRNase/pAp phosphatase (c-di-AMP/oligoRNAs hydrolase)
MDNQKIVQLIPQVKELLQGADSIGIVVTEFQSLDKVGAGLALFLALQEAGKNVQIVSKKEPLVEISNLVGIDKLQKSFDGMTKKLVVSLPYYEGEVEKVSYNIEGNRLNINLFATKDKGISFSEKDVNFIRSGSNPSVLVTIGIRKEDELSGIVSSDSDVKIIRLDTVVPQQDFGAVTLADSEFSSISEIVSLLIREMGLPIDTDIAQNLMDGVVAATNNFSAQNTSSAAFASAAYLLAHNAHRKSPVQPQRSGEQRRSQSRQESSRFQQAPFQNKSEAVEKATVSQNEIPQVTENQSPDENKPTESQASFQDGDHKEQVQSEASDKENVPSDWFVPKVFRSSKPQE